MVTCPHGAYSLVGEPYIYGKVTLKKRQLLSEISVWQATRGVLGEPFPKGEILELS